MNNPLVGIYMPCYNVANYIGEAIKSIIAQDMDNWTLVVLDDGSDDNTYEVAQEIIDGRCFLAGNGKHSGLIGKLKNEAIGLLPETEFVCHLGADDIISPNCLSSFVDFMTKNPNLDAVCGTFDCFDNIGNRWMLPHVMADEEFNPIKLLSFMNFYPMRFYKRKVIYTIGGYSELSSAVDYDLALRLSEQFKLGRLNKILYHYRQHSTQVSTAARKEQDLNAKKALQASLDRRGLKQEVINDAPPFQLRERQEEHFIWGKK